MRTQSTADRYENLGNIERVVRFTLSYIVIVALLESTITGSTLFAVLNMIATAIAVTGITGWDPLKAFTNKAIFKLQLLFHVHDDQHGRKA